MRARSRVAVPALIIIAACDGASRDGAAPAPAEAAVPGPAQSIDSTGFDTALVSIRATTQGVAIHDGASVEDDRRLALSFRGDSTPAVVVSYVTGPVVQCGSGEPVSVAGTAVLHIRMSPADAHEFDGERAIVTVEDRDRTLGGPLMSQLTMTCDFEAQVEWVVGLSRRVPFRASTAPTGEVVIELLP